LGLGFEVLDLGFKVQIVQDARNGHLDFGLGFGDE